MLEKTEYRSIKNLDTVTNESIKKYLNGIISRGQAIKISEEYTELSAKEILPKTFKSDDEKSDEEQDFKVLELVKENGKLILSGESGSGKTTTLKWLNFIYATNCLEEKEGNIPLYVELNAYIEGSFYDYVKRKANSEGISEDILKIILKGKAILFLDGIDLLSPKDDFRPYEQISNFIYEYSNCKFVISSKPSFLESIISDLSDFKVSELEKLTDEKIQQFIDNVLAKKDGDMIKNKIFNDERLKSILTTPMMLYIATKVAKERKGNMKDLLPTDRSEMYEAFVYGLFSHYGHRTGRALHANKTQIENTLINLYFELQCRNEVSCKNREALKIVRKHAGDDTYKEEFFQNIFSDSFDLGLLVKNDSKIEYGIHQSFQEYFAAIKLKELFESGCDISEAFYHPKWEEVVIFTSEMLDSDSIDEFIDSMLSKEYQKLKSQPELFLASKCVSKASENTKKKLCALLAKKMDSKYNLEKINSIESLGKIGNIGIRTLLDKALDDNDADVRRSAANALGNMKSEDAVKPLIAALKDKNKDEDVRLNVAKALGKIKSEKAVELLISVLKDKDEDKDVRGAAEKALGLIKSEKAVEPLIAVLKDKNEDKDVRGAAEKALGLIKSEKAVEPLIAVLKDKNEDEDVQGGAEKALGLIKSEKAVEPLIAALNDKDKGVRLNVAKALGKIKSEKAVEPLIAVLKNKDEDEKVQLGTSDALGKIKSEKAVELLVAALNDKDKDVRLNAANALGKIKSEKAVEPLIAALNDKDKDVRWRVAAALGLIESEDAVALLIAVLKDKDEDKDVRRGAALALGRIRSKDSVEPLITVLKDKDENKDVQRNAAEALGLIESEDAVEPLVAVLKNKNEDKGMLWRVVSTLGKIKSEKAVEPLIAVLKDKNEDEIVRRIAVFALGKIRSKDSVEPLIAVLKNKDEDKDVQLNVAEALGEIRAEDAVEPLIIVLKDKNENKDVQREAAKALGKICTIKDKNKLEDLLESENELSANTAFEILDKIEKEEKSKTILFREKSQRSESSRTFKLISKYPIVEGTIATVLVGIAVLAIQKRHLLISEYPIVEGTIATVLGGIVVLVIQKRYFP